MFLAGSVRMSLITPLFCNRHLRHASYCFQKAAKPSQNLPFVRHCRRPLVVLAPLPMWPAIYLFSAFLFVALVAMNVWYWRRRSRMTPEERREQDAEDRRDATLW